MFYSTKHASLKLFPARRQFKVPSRSFVLIIAYLLFAFSLYAQTETLNDSWRWVQFNTETGLPSNRVADIVETPAGTVWAVTQSGLAWFNGYYWIPVDLPGGTTKGRFTAVIPNEDDSLFVIVDGNLYIGGGKGFRPIPFVQNGRTLNPICAARLSNGFLLATSSSLFVLRNGVIEPFNSNSELQSNKIIGLWTTRSNGIWLNTTSGLYKWEQMKWLLKIPAKNKSFRASRVVENTMGEGLAIVEYPAEQSGIWEWEPNGMPTQNNVEVKQPIQALDLSPSDEGIAAYESGEVRTRQDGKWSALKPLPPQMRNIVFLKFRDNGDLWVGTENNLYLHRHSSKRWTFWRHPSSAMKNRINEILLTKDGSLWLARDLDIEIHGPKGQVLEIENINGATLKGLTGLAEDNDGNVWVSSGTYPIGAYRWNGVTWRHFGTKDGLGAETIHKIRRDREGKLWFLGIAKTPYGIEGEENEPGAYVYSQGRFSRWGIEKGLLNERVYAFAEGADSDFGLARMGD